MSMIDISWLVVTVLAALFVAGFVGSFFLIVLHAAIAIWSKK